MFVRKRDPRYKAHLKHQSQPPITSSARPPVLQTDAEPAAVYVEQEWQKTSVSGVEDLEWALAEGNDDPEVFECVACGKLFKSEAAWNSHERSKKHIKNVEVLRLQMEEEGRKLGLSHLSDELGHESAESGEQSEGSVTPPLGHGPGTEHENPRDARESPEPREQGASVEETLPGRTDETEQSPSQPEQKLSKRDKRRLREAKKQAQEVDSTHVSVGRSR